VQQGKNMVSLSLQTPPSVLKLESSNFAYTPQVNAKKVSKKIFKIWLGVEIEDFSRLSKQACPRHSFLQLMAF